LDSVEIGIALALLAALMANLGSLLKHRGCQHVAPLQFREPIRSARGLAGSRWFAAGWGLAAVAWLVHVAALSLAPISLVQSVLAGGAVTLAVMSQRLFGDAVHKRQWAGLLLGGLGLGLLVATVPHFSGSHSSFSLAAIVGFEGGLALIAGGLALGHRSEQLAARQGVLLAALSGTLFALAGVAIKGLTGAAPADPAVAVPWIGLIVVCGALAQYTAAVALQRGSAIETIGLMGLVANAMQISAGIVVFGDPLSNDPAGLAMQVVAFAMVCLSGLLLPVRNPGEGSARLSQKLA
jgi:hypothetical protein